jgi:glycosyltransferase involved in cell wall biosynthesis
MISVVIPLYNGEKFIEKTLRDVTGGTERSLEIIVVDDGSGDFGADIVKRMAEGDKRIKYLKKDNGGIASARNYGLSHATGEYICFIDQDDFVYPDMFTVLREDIEITGADFVRAKAAESTDGNTVWDGGTRSRVVVKRDSLEHKRYLQGLVMGSLAPHQEYRTGWSIWCCMFRTDFLRKNNIHFLSYLDYEDDWMVSVNALAAADTVCFEDRTVYCWRVHASSESHNRITHDRYIDDFYEKYCSFREFLLDAVRDTEPGKKEMAAFERELQKRALLWDLSNETGRGIEGRSIGESTVEVKKTVAWERKRGIKRGIVTHSLTTTGLGVSFAKKLYHKLREAFVTFLLLHHMEGAAVYLNHKILHGRWHI